MIVLSWIPIYLVYASNSVMIAQPQSIAGLAMALELISSALNANDAIPFARIPR
jgi:hypothetical protein